MIHKSVDAGKALVSNRHRLRQSYKHDNQGAHRHIHWIRRNVTMFQGSDQLNNHRQHADHFNALPQQPNKVVHTNRAQVSTTTISRLQELSEDLQQLTSSDELVTLHSTDMAEVHCAGAAVLASTGQMCHLGCVT